MEEVLVESEKFLDDAQHAKDIFIIDDTEDSNSIQKYVKNPSLAESRTERKVFKSSKFFSTLLKSSRNIFGKRLINVST